MSLQVSKTFTVYRHITPSGKSYIGITCYENNLNRRWKNGEGYTTSPKFYAAIKKYGWDNIEHEILEQHIPIENISEREKYWIKYYDTFDSDKGYNLTSGGFDKKEYSEETRLKLSIAASKPKTEEHKQKLREAILGKKHTIESCKKMSQARGRKVCKLDLDDNILAEYDSIKEAAQQNHCDASSISKVCKQLPTHKTCGGFKWSYKEDCV